MASSSESVALARRFLVRGRVQGGVPRLLLSVAHIVAFFCVVLPCAAGNKQQEGEALVQQAAGLSLFESRDALAFHLRLHLKLAGMQSGSVDGSYSWRSSANGQWRQELSFADFTQLQGGSSDRVWQKRSLNYEPMPASWVLDLAKNLRQLKLSPDEEVKSIYKERDSRCLDLRSKDDWHRALCFDGDGLLTRVVLPGQDMVYEYLDYTALAGKRFPRTMRVIWKSQQVVDANLEELAPDSEISGDVFAAPAGAAERADCQFPQVPHLLRKVMPQYPAIVRNQHQGGTVTLYIEIAKDGSVRNPTVIQTGGPALNEAALDAVKQWRYSPYTCGNTPVELETTVTVKFFMP